MTNPGRKTFDTDETLYVTEETSAGKTHLTARIISGAHICVADKHPDTGWYPVHEIHANYGIAGDFVELTEQEKRALLEAELLFIQQKQDAREQVLASEHWLNQR